MRVGRAVGALVALAGYALTVWCPAHAAPDETPFAVLAPLASRSLLLDGQRLDGRLVAVGERGHVVYSDAGGKTWTQARVPTRSLLTAVHFHDQKLGWAVGHDAVVLRTRDGGATWERVHHAPEEERPLLDVWFSDARHGFAVGAYGYFLETRDGGETWEDRAVSDDDWHLNHIARLDSGKLVIAAEAGNLYASEDSGETWESLPSPYVGSLFRVMPLGEDGLLLLGLRGHLFRSEDGGQHWTQVETGTDASLLAALRLPDGRLVVAGLGGTVLWSTDGGRSFTLRQEADRLDIAGLVAGADGRVLALGHGGIKALSAP